MASSTLTQTSGIPGGARPAVRRAADWVHLAATPTFVVMVLLTIAHDGGMPDMMCGRAQDVSPLNGMALMYLLMSAFHSTPWLNLVSSRFGLSGTRSLRFDPGKRHDNER